LVAETCSPFRNRVYPPLVTLAAFLCQVFSRDHSCRDAVARVLAERLAQGQAACSSDTGPYCTARQRLSEALIVELVRETGRALDQNSQAWTWKGRSVKLVDGTTVSMPDTPKNQAAYPQCKDQESGLGFPISRVVAVISLSCGGVRDFAMGRYQGKQTGEHALLRPLIENLSPGDLLLGDAYYGTYFLIARLQQRGMDGVFQRHGSRRSDFRRGQRLGPKDHRVVWTKPRRPKWMDPQTYQEMPMTLTVREVKSKGKVLVTTLLDPKQATRQELGELYTRRWAVEVDLRFIKSVLQMDVLRCQSPEMVRKELGVHLLAYNLIRTVMAQAAQRAGVAPRTLSFKATLQLLEKFQGQFILAKEARLLKLHEDLLAAIARHRVGNRPGRCEPRAIKRRPKSYPRLTEPRHRARKRLSVKKQCA
jgi:hypothetical protein